MRSTYTNSSPKKIRYCTVNPQVKFVSSLNTGTKNFRSFFSYTAKQNEQARTHQTDGNDSFSLLTTEQILVLQWQLQ